MVGAGASELILRLIRCIDGSVQQLVPTFSEYALGARLAGRRLMSVRSPGGIHCARNRHAPGIGFVCWPNNPTGELWPLDFVAAAAAAGPLVVDMAYAPFCDASLTAAIETAASRRVPLVLSEQGLWLDGRARRLPDHAANRSAHRGSRHRVG